MSTFDKNTMARIHSVETMGTVDGPRPSFCCIYAGMPSSL